MPREKRDVTGGDKMMADVVPMWGIILFILGWFTVPIETFLRRNFGERYYTAPNFFAGFILLLLVQFIGWILRMLNPISIIASVFGRGGSDDSWMSTITQWYVYLGIFHFLRIWFNNVIGTPQHSFSAGKSWLRPMGRALMFVLNLFLNAIVRLIFAINPTLDKRRLEFALPVLQDVDVFTERFVEPLFVIFVGLLFAASGQTTVFFWLFFSAMALNIYTTMRHEQQRGYWLDIQDSMIEANYFHQAKYGESSSSKKSHERMLKKTAFEVEINPDMATVIERNNPTLADAMKAVSPKLQKMVNTFPSDQEGRQAA
ncbi:hypothetical protein GCM10028808_62640 [Spirosoma migulaei]